jgi:cation transport ATPase
VAQNTGIGLATGKRWQVTFMGINNDTIKELGDSSKSGNSQKEYKTGINWFVLGSLLFGVIAMVFSFLNWPHRSLAVMGASLVSALLLIAAFIHLKISLSKLSTGNKSDSLDFNMSGMIKVDFTIWYYLSLVAFAAAAFLAYKHTRIELQDKLNESVKFEFQSIETTTENIKGDA